MGSIGVYTTLADFTGFYEKEGIKVHEIYSTLSTEKNKPYKEALKGNYEQIQNGVLDPLAAAFIGAIKTNRKKKLNTSEGNPFKGKLYMAEEAMAIGLIDSIGSFETAVSRVRELAKSNQEKSKQISMSKNISKVLGVEKLESTKEGVFLTEEQLTKIETALDAKDADAKLKEKADAMEAEIVAAVKVLKPDATEKETVNISAGITALLEENKKLGGKAGAVHSDSVRERENLGSGGIKFGEDKEADYFANLGKTK